METYFAGNPITVDVPFVTSAGVQITGPDTASYRVLDSEDLELVASTPLTPGGADTSASISIAGPINALGQDVPRDARVVEVTFSKGGTDYVTTLEYLVQSAEALQVQVNSFQTYSQSLVASGDLADIDSFRAADRAARIPAMINAWHNLCRLSYYVSGRTYARISSVTPESFAEFPAGFVRALRLAQIVEANEFLAGDTIHKKRQAGLMSETIGESSMFFRPEKVLLVPATRRSMDLLRGYLVWGMGIGRA